MKILWIVHLEVDYGEAMLYDGLCRVLGDGNVVDFPYKYMHHGQNEKALNQNVRNYLKSVTGEIPYWVGPPGKQGSSPLAWEISRGGVDYPYADILNMVKAGHFDLIVLAHPRAVAIWFLEQLFKDLGNVHQKAPVVMCDFEDYHEVRRDLLQKFSIGLSFKASYTQSEPNVYGLPLCSPITANPNLRFDDSLKTVDVTARWGLTHPLRVKVLNEIKSVRGVVKAEGRLNYVKYLRELAMSKIGVSMGGYTTGPAKRAQKHWEIPSYRTMLLCENPCINYPHPFEDGKTCVFFNPNAAGDVKRKIEYYINHDKERQTIAEAGHEHLKKYHTTTARARYFLEVCAKHYPQLKGKVK